MTKTSKSVRRTSTASRKAPARKTAALSTSPASKVRGRKAAAPARRAKAVSAKPVSAKSMSKATGLSNVAPRAKRLVSRVKRAVSNAVASR